MTSLSLSAPAQASHALRAPIQGFEPPAPTGEQVADAKELREAFTKFVGTTVFGQMLSSMRATVGEPAYFHGGRAEEMFQSQLDQTLADEMTTGGGSPFAHTMFEHQFPDAARILKQAPTLKPAEPALPPEPLLRGGDNPFEQLNALPRR